MRIVAVVTVILCGLAATTALAKDGYDLNKAQKKQAADYTKSMAPKKHNAAACFKQCRARPAAYGCPVAGGIAAGVGLAEQCCKKKCGA